MRKLFLLCLLAFSIGNKSLAASAPKVICVKNTIEQFNLVYLHGLDGTEPGSLELENRLILKNLAKKLGFRLAIMRSNETCKTRKCWPQSTPQLFQETLAAIKATLPACLDMKKKTLLFGFSNGGYFVNKLAQTCDPNFSALASSGAAGNPKFLSLPTPAPKQCPGLTMMIGDKDISLKKAATFQKGWQHTSVKLEYQVFKGKHQVDRTSLQNWLKLQKTP